MTVITTFPQILDIHQLIKRNELFWRLGMIFASLLLVLDGVIHYSGNVSLTSHREKEVGARDQDFSQGSLFLNISIVS